ncbi:MAG: uracil-DNA glycosylase family protein [Ruminiclostridium sp.]|nr:uracil-DNA glycosylase family protein [Ruminiclostridium sp.]
MIDNIRVCSKCNLCNNQEPLLDDMKLCQVFWVGLSAKKVSNENERPLSPTTNSGKLIYNVEGQCSGVITYKTNLVKCVPLDERQKLRYPNRREIDICFPNLENEIKELLPKIVFLLGDKVATTISKQFHLDFLGWDEFNYSFTKHNGIYYVPIHHPSYIYVYKRKHMDVYIKSIASLIEVLL